MRLEELESLLGQLSARIDQIKAASEVSEGLVKAISIKVVALGDTRGDDESPGIIPIPNDETNLSRAEWVALFRQGIRNLEADKDLKNRKAHLVNLRELIDRALFELDRILAPDPE